MCAASRAAPAFSPSSRVPGHTSCSPPTWVTRRRTRVDTAEVVNAGLANSSLRGVPTRTRAGPSGATHQVPGRHPRHEVRRSHTDDWLRANADLHPRTRHATGPRRAAAALPRRIESWPSSTSPAWRRPPTRQSRWLLIMSLLPSRRSVRDSTPSGSCCRDAPRWRSVPVSVHIMGHRAPASVLPKVVPQCRFFLPGTLS